MHITCICGTVLSNTALPNDVEHLLLSTRAIEWLQHLVDREVNKDGTVDLWPEHWEQSGAVEVWKCFECNRLYFNVGGPPEKLVVYSAERTGVEE